MKFIKPMKMGLYDAEIYHTKGRMVSPNIINRMYDGVWTVAVIVLVIACWPARHGIIQKIRYAMKGNAKGLLNRYQMLSLCVSTGIGLGIILISSFILYYVFMNGTCVLMPPSHLNIQQQTCKPTLDGPIKLELDENVTTKGLHRIAMTINKGGWWRPSGCVARKKVAIIIPFRARDTQLNMFLYHMHPFLQKQMLAYTMIVVEQLPGDDFNKGSLLNIGFELSQNMSRGTTPFDCFIFHDVDYLPEDDRNDYGCVTSPRHLSMHVNIWEYKPRGFHRFLGGVFSVNKTTFEMINGMSNLYFGWGSEDNDVYQRMVNRKLKITRPSPQVSRYTQNPHGHFRSSTPNPKRLTLVKTINQRMDMDGLNSLKYHLSEIVEKQLYTLIRVEVKKHEYVYPTFAKDDPHWRSYGSFVTK